VLFGVYNMKFERS